MNLFEYYKNNPALLTWTIIIFLVCAAIGVAAIFIRKWLRNKRMEKPLIIHATEKDYQFSEAETDISDSPDAIEIYDDEDNIQGKN